MCACCPSARSTCDNANSFQYQSASDGHVSASQHLLADELLELLKREKELKVPSRDCDPYVDAYLKADAASTTDHIATEAGHP